MPELCDLQIHVNGQQTFFVNEEIISKYSGKLRKIIQQEKRRTQIRNSGINVDDFPGGPDGFELVSRFCYNNGAITITVSNVSLLHCCAVFLGMNKSKNVSTCNLLQQTETFLEGMFYWSWNDLLTCLKSCEPFFSYADSSGLVQKLMSSLLSKIAQNSDINFSASSSSSSSSPDTAASGRFKPCSSNSIKVWWLDDLTILPPKIMEKFVKTLGAYGSDNNSLVLTKFLLHYLKSAVVQRKGSANSKSDYGGLADTAVHGVISVGKSSFSCRGLLSVMRVVTGFGLSRDCRAGLERLIGGMLDEAKLDDLLVSGHNHAGVYDVNLVLRLVRLFVHRDDGVPAQKMKKVGRLIDKYLGEIAPDHNLKISKFLGVAESLPDFARDSFDGVYRAIDIYLESHPSLSLEERSRLCRCLRYEKMSLEACKDLAKNPRIPPRIAVQALVSQHPNIPTTEFHDDHQESTSNTHQMVMMYKRGVGDDDAADQSFPDEDENEDLKLNLQRMRWRVGELEKVCREMKSQMSRMMLVKSKVINAPPLNRALPRLC